MKKTKLSKEIKIKKKKNIYDLFKNYNGNYVCKKFDSKDIKEKEIW